MSTVAVGYAVTGPVSVAILLVAWRWPPAGRLLYAVLFLAAGIFNGVTAVRTPEV
jgi:hypothetical protein